MNTETVNPQGRPPIIATPERFDELAREYFAECDETQQTPTVNGLCLKLDMTRETLLRYGEKEGFSDTVRKTRQKLEMAWEQKLAGNNVTGAIFWLKNQGWADKVEQTFSNPDGTGLFSGLEVKLVRPSND